MKKIESIEVLNKILQPFEGTKYNTNAYFFENEFVEFIQSGTLFFDIFSANMVLYKYNVEFDFYELYYYIKETSTSINISDDASFVMEIPYRGSKNFPSTIVDFFKSSGFVRHLNRDLLRLVNPKESSLIISPKPIEYRILEDLNLAHFICDSIQNTFDTFTGDILTIEEVCNFIKSKNFIGAYKDGVLCGFLRFYVKNKVAWASHLIVLPQFRGEGIGNGLFCYYLKINSDEGLNNFQHWVVSDNLAALKLYDNLGYIATNKNSISLLKKKIN